jgi:pyruvate dehydrogenase E2 component (dihydrolipoamide acetyltransferase)
MGPLRKVIAARMAEAKRTIPHYRVGVDIGMDALLSLRAEANAAQLENKLSVNDCLIKACALALIEIAELNCCFVDNEIHRYTHANISIVVPVEGGLSTPVIREADTKTVREISKEVKEIVARAARNALRMDEILGGSFSLSNLGMCGVDTFDAIINAPQVAILAVGQTKRQVIVSGSDEIRIASVLRATLSADHRIIDGATSAAFLKSLQDIVQKPQRLFE